MRQFFAHFWILLHRNARLFIVDRTGLILAVAQAPVIALFIILALRNNVHDYQQSDSIMRKSYSFIKAVADDRDNTEGMYDNYRNLRAKEYYSQAMKEMDKVISPHHAQARATIFFVMLSASIWMGLLGSCKEIVTEWKIIQRESHSAFSPGAYILSKLCVFGTVLWLQVICLVTITLFGLIHDFTPSMLLCHFAINWLVGFGATVIGLLLSCLINSVRWAMALVPVIMMPQILMGGLLRPPAQMAAMNQSVIRKACSSLTLQRWGFEAELIIDTRLASSDSSATIPSSHMVAILSHNPNETAILYQPKCTIIPIDEYFFSNAQHSSWERIQPSLAFLCIFAIFLTTLTIICLTLRLRFANLGYEWCS